MEIAKSTKVLGFMIDSRSNNLAQIRYIKEKMKKAKKMQYIALNQKMSTWRRFYIYNQYISPHLRYGALMYFSAKPY